MKPQNADRLENKHKPAKPKKEKNTLEKLKKFTFVVYIQDLLLSPFTVQKHPEGCVWWRLGSREQLKPRSVVAEAEHSSLPRGTVRTQSCCPPCQQQAEQTGSIPVPVLTNAGCLSLWQPCLLCSARCAALGSALPSFLNPRATVTLNSQGPSCTVQPNDFLFTNRDASLFM